MTKEIREIIETYEPLKQWFIRNQKLIESNENPVLNSMLSCAYRWLGTPKAESQFTPNTRDFKIASAVIGMAHIYNTYLKSLSEEDQENLRISYKAEGYGKAM